ncbi:MAG: hypothetical protein CO170_03170 [candidate division SR1 bacterium CG_4_9_14_3_um_filter_40_9]|nr:MAG: hypothetical protein CO170_03170 [candidate division SR1 bacterium CG_4_9_14_3_um_filter_40_9]
MPAPGPYFCLPDAKVGLESAAGIEKNNQNHRKQATQESPKTLEIPLQIPTNHTLGEASFIA